MKNNQHGFSYIIIVIALTVVTLGAVGYMWYTNQSNQEPDTNQQSSTSKEAAVSEYTSEKKTELVVTSPQKNSIISSPLTVTGKVPGSWSFEANFPLELIDENGIVVASGNATLDGDWMTDELVGFSGELSYDTPPATPTGYLILHKDNPSGLEKNGDQLSIPVKFSDK